MTENMKKIFGDDEEFITLSDLSGSENYSLEHLLICANSGKLKAFKMGDDWLTTMDWFLDYKTLIKKEISHEVDDSEDEENGWIDFLPDGGFKLMFVPQMILILIIFSVFSFSLSWLLYSPSGNSAAMAVSDITDHRHTVGNYFLTYINLIYGSTSKPVSFVASNSVLSIAMVYNSTLATGNDILYLASVFDSKFGDYKINDEVITIKTKEFVKSAKSGYQDVAGASHIRQQIYFDEWKESVEFDNYE